MRKRCPECNCLSKVIKSLLEPALLSTVNNLRAVLLLSGFHAGSPLQCNQVFRPIIIYLAKTKLSGFQYHGDELEMSGSVDFDYAVDLIDRKSTSGSLINLRNAVYL